MATAAQIRASKKYNEANRKTFALHVNRKTESDILKKLESMDNREGYLKSLIRQDIERRA
jgi:hypothetical protein